MSDQTAVKQTAFHDIHVASGAKMVEFAGFEMPIQYTGIIEEHRRVRESVGVFDVSHMGEVEILGKDALAMLQKVTVNDVSKLSPGRVQYSAMCYEDGGIVDDLLVYNLGDRYMLVVNASNIEKDVAWLQQNVSGDARVVNRSDEFSLLAVQGPKSLDTLKDIVDVDLSSIQYYNFKRGKIAGVDAIISRTGYTGELGYEVYFTSKIAAGKAVWEAIMKSGSQFNIAPVGLGARDTLRLEMGFCLYGNDIDKSTHPLEAGLGWITKMDKGDFNGKQAMLDAKSRGLNRRLVGFILAEKAFPRHGYTITNAGTQIGTVTSGTFSPILDKGIGMGYVRTEYSRPGANITIAIRNKEVAATVTAVPFIKK